MPPTDAESTSVVRGDVEPCVLRRTRTQSRSMCWDRQPQVAKPVLAHTEFRTSGANAQTDQALNTVRACPIRAVLLYAVDSVHAGEHAGRPGRSGCCHGCCRDKRPGCPGSPAATFPGPPQSNATSRRWSAAFAASRCRLLRDLRCAHVASRQPRLPGHMLPWDTERPPAQKVGHVSWDAWLMTRKSDVQRRGRRGLHIVPRRSVG
jgi:hypothetical protein